MNTTLKSILLVVLFSHFPASESQRDPYFIFLRNFALEKELKLANRKFNTIKEYEIHKWENGTFELSQCINHEDLSFLKVKIPFNAVNLDTTKHTDFKRSFTRKINKGVSGKDYFAASDLITLNDTLALIGLYWGDVSYLDVLIKNDVNQWKRYCAISYVVYD